MQIKPKTTTVHQQKSDTYSKPMDLSGYVDVPDMVITAGKHSGKTWKWVIDNDPSYTTWMRTSGVCIQWGCMALPEQKEVKRYSGFISSAGEHWVGVREVEGSGKMCPNSWLYGQTSIPLYSVLVTCSMKYSQQQNKHRHIDAVHSHRVTDTPSVCRCISML